MGLMQLLFRSRAVRRREPRPAMPPSRRAKAWSSRRRSASRLGRFEQLEGRALLAGLTGFELDTLSTIEATNASETLFSGEYTFGADGNVTSFAYNGTAIDNLTVSPLTKNGITSTSSTNNFRGNNWPLGATNGSDVFTIGDVNTEKYIEFTLAAAEGFVIEFPTITFGVGRSATGPRQWQWRSSVDGYTTPIIVTTVSAGLTHVNGVLTNPDSNASWTGNVIDTFGNQSYADLGAVSFRLYGYNSEGEGGTGGLQGTLTFGGTLKEGAPVSPPVIFTSGSLAPLGTTAGTPSASRSFGATGSNLTDGILVTAPANFEVSVDDVSFGPTTTLAASGGNASGTIFVRLAANAAVGATTGNVTLTSDGAPTVNVAVSGSVRPTVIELPYGPEDFETTSEPWFTYDAGGSANWQFVTTTRGNGQASGQPANRVWQVNGFASTEPADDWLMLGPFDLSSAADPTITFASLNAFTSGGVIVDELSLKVSADFTGDGDPSNATWTPLTFAKPAGENTKTPAGQVALEGMAGEAAVYVAFHYEAAGTGSGETALWQIDDVAVFDLVTPALNLVVPGAINEGTEGVAGAVTIPQPIDEPLEVLITSGDADRLLVREEGGEAAATLTVTIPAGATSAGFRIDTIRDFRFGPDVLVTLTASVNDESYDPASATINVRNIDSEATPLTTDGYTQDFATFVAEATLPTGWAIAADGSGGNRFDRSNWGVVATGVKHSADVAGQRVNVFGYQHTSTTGIATQTLTLQNDTGDEITAVTISYVGRADRPNETRTPSYTVTVDGQPVPALAYSTSEGDGVRKTFVVTGLAIPVDRAFEIVWTSDRGFNATGTSQTIGISDVTVAAGVQIFEPLVTSLTVPPLSISRESAEASAEVTSDGGGAVTARGFVYIATAELPEGEPLTLATPGVVVVTAGDGVGGFSQTLGDLTVATAYTIRGYATNEAGTGYTGSASFTTLGPPASLAGGYQQLFADYDGTLPVGWSVVSSGGVTGVEGVWGEGFTGGFRRPQPETGGVLGYQHTAGTGVLTITLALVNDTGATIDTLDVGYLGRVARPEEFRTPEWRVSVNGVEVPELAYSTDNADGDEGEPVDLAVATQFTGLGLGVGEVLTITWVSERGLDGQTGASRQIGIGDVAVAAVTAAPEVTLGAPAVSLVTLSSARLRGSVTAANGSISAHGVVYALTSDNADPESGGDNVTVVEIAGGGPVAFDFFTDVTGLEPGAEYSFKAFATNSLGTSYSAAATWTTATEATVPTVTTPTATAVTGTTATVGGTVESDGGATITEYGVVLAVASVNATPSVGDDGVIVVSEAGAISGVFTLPATGLAANTTYAFRAYAVNSEGTSYSTVGSFTTPALPTALAVGDLSIIGLNANAPDGFAFVTWVDLAPNTQIKFTDNAFLSTGSANDVNNARGGENFVTWTNTSGGAIAAGTVVTIVEVAGSAPAAATASIGTTAQGLSGLATAGDQIFAYQGAGAGTTTTTSDFGANTNPTTFTGSLVFGLNYGADWLSEPGITVSTNTSYLPSELAGPSASIALTTTSTTRGQYAGSRAGFATLSDAKAAVTNPANWTTGTGAGTFVLDTTPFFIGELVATTTTLGAITPLTVDFGDTVTFAGTVAAASGTATPTGTVEIRDGGPIGTLLATTSTITGSDGTGSFSIDSAEIAVGTYADIQAFFLPTGGFAASSSPAFGSTLTVVSTAKATSITLDEVTPLASTVGMTITFSGTIAADEGSATPAGTIEIRSGGVEGQIIASTTTITGTGGTGSYSISVSNLPVGVYGVLQAFFVGNTSFAGSGSEVFIDPLIVRPESVSPQFVRWTFEGDSLLPLVGAGMASAIGGATQTFAAGNRGGRAMNTATYPAQGEGSGTRGVQFMVSTAGRDSITLSFDHQPSNTASRWAQVDYTLDGGETWVTGYWNNGGNLPGVTFSTFTVDFGGVTGANDNPDFGVRIVSIFEPGTSAYQAAGATSTYGTAGTWRFDNVTFGGFGGPTIRTSTGIDSLRVVTYNIAAAGETGQIRQGLDTVLAAIGTEIVAGWSGPIDLLALQEVQSQTATTQLVVDALNGVHQTTTYARGSVDGASTGGGTMGVVYNTNSLTLLEEVSIASGGPRNTMRYLFQPVAATQSEIFYVYVSHFKASDTTADRATRAQEAAALRADADLLGAGTSILYVGDFNVYTSSETAYQTLLGSGGGQAFDPIDRPGNWSKNAGFKDVFTQAPLVTGVNGLVGGGLNDRFDFQLVTDAVLNGTGLNYTSDTYRPFGNNGSVNVSGAINSESNTALAGMPNRLDVLNALTTASDHLPVVADYSVPTVAALQTLSTTQGTASEARAFAVRARNLTGNLSVTAPAGFELSTSATDGFSSEPLPLGSTAGTVNATVYIRLAAGTAVGSYGGDISISGGDAATSTLVMPTSTVTDELAFDVAVGQTVTQPAGTSGAIKLVKRGGGTLILDLANGHSGGTIVEEGEVIVRNIAALGTGTLEIRAGAKVTLDVGSVNWFGGTNFVSLSGLLLDPAGRFEIGIGQIRVAAGGFDVAAIRAALVAGRNTGAWNGASGFTSAAAGVGTSRAIGYREVSGVLRLGFAAFGDANLDGQVSLADINLVNNGGRFGQGAPANWVQGDFNYSNTLTLADINLLNNSALFGQGSYLPPQPAEGQLRSAGVSDTSSTADDPQREEFDEDGPIT